MSPGAHRDQKVRFREARVTGDCEPPTCVLGTELQSSTRSSSILAWHLSSPFLCREGVFVWFILFWEGCLIGWLAFLFFVF